MLRRVSSQFDKSDKLRANQPRRQERDQLEADDDQRDGWQAALARWWQNLDLRQGR